MKLRSRAPLAPSPLLSPAPAPAPASRWAALLARMRASTWTAVAAKVGAVVVALLVLGWIGRTASAGSSPASPPASGREVVEADAAAPLATPPLSSAVDAGTGPSPPVAAPAVAATPPGARGRASSTEPVFLNHASVEELRRLPGVGPKRAEAILVLRQRLGRFQRVEDLLRVKGIGRGAVKKWRPLVRLDTPEAGAP